jgi:molecular chaperone GrpE (heat shock protein)
LQSDGNVKSVKEVLGVARSSGESNSYYTNDVAEKIGTLYCDAKSLAATDAQAALSAEQLKQLEDNIRKTIMSGYRENAHAVEQSIKVQGESLGKHLAEFREVTETAKAAALNENKSSDTELGELAQQISAIRDYTSCQQDRIEKLQDGYDWTIMRTFCLKIIRCIDNLENRIRTMSENGLATEMLEDIRDELLFSLESSSVEQFDLEVNSEYSGNEKLAEVIKDKSPCKDESMKGKIASLIRPGYQYVIDEGSTKVVRVARVKLFG